MPAANSSNLLYIQILAAVQPPIMSSNGLTVTGTAS